MSIFDRFKRSGKREYMKYEDGKIVPVKAEEPSAYREFALPPFEQKEEALDIKNLLQDKLDVSGKVKKYSTWKTLKLAGAVAVVIFFGFTVKDVYVAFTDPAPNHTVVTSPSNPPSSSTQKEPGSPSNQQAPIPQGDEDGQDVPKEEKSPLKTALDTSNDVNSFIVSETAKELNNLNYYLDNKLNKFSLEKNLNASLKTKKELSVYLAERKETFEKEDLPSFYKTTEDRLNNSIHLSEAILASFNNPSVTNEELTALVNDFVETENVLKDKQNKSFIQLLDKKEIEYTYDKEKGEINYTIK